MKNLLLTFLFLVVIFLVSCTPASQGTLSQDEKGCTTLTNNSSTEKITFVLKYATINYSYEKTVGPKEQTIVGCSEEAKTLTILSAYNSK